MANRLFAFAIAALLPLALIPSTALAQSTAQNESAAARPVVTPSTSPQLRPGEQLYFFANRECATVDEADNAAQRRAKYWGRLKWFGACRFGTAHGAGYVGQPSGPYEPRNFAFGFRPLARSGVNGWKFGAQDNYSLGLGRFIVLMPEKQDIASLGVRPGTDTIQVHIYYDASPQRTVNEYGTITFACPYLRLHLRLPLSEAMLDRRFKAEAVAQCKQSVPGTGIYPGGRAVYHSRWEYGADGQSVASTPERPNPVLVEAASCPFFGASSHCEIAFQKLLAPQRARIDQVISGDAAAQAAAIAEVRARYVSLEAELHRQVAAIAARYASQARPSSPVAPTPDPVARPRPRKGVPK